jgi:2-oxoglutarate dehydrogenase E1 component
MAKIKIDRESFLFSANADFIEELYLKYIENPGNVDDYWQNFFAQLGDENASRSIKGASWLPRKNKVILPQEVSPATLNKKPATNSCDKIDSVKLLISQYRAYGHYLAKLDPLCLEKDSTSSAGLELSHYGLSESDLDLQVMVNHESLGLNSCSIRDVIARLKEVYCTSVGYEVSHLSSDEEREWFYTYVENMTRSYTLSKEEKIDALKELIDVEGFEQFIHSRFPGAKRFSIEGGEVSILVVKEVIKRAAIESKLEEVVLGMPHRGRLNMLTKVMGKDYAAMLSEFQGNLAHMEELNISGDVKYHLGKSSDYIAENGHKVHLSLTANPSHLEAVNPVVVGKVRAKQDGLGDKNREKVMGILLHGDAAFSGQGVVVETLCLSDLESYRTGGTMHVVVNNQVGFTTLPKDARAGRYPTEFAKVIQAPVIHVNGDDIEKALMVARIAEAYRHKFKKDIVIDVVCYRKYGHNEGDEPMFTQPIMYELIKSKQSSVDIYSNHISASGLFSQEQIIEYRKEKMSFFDQKFEQAKSYKPQESDWLKSKWQGFEKHDKVTEPEKATGLSIDKLKQIGEALVNYPQDMKLNSKVLRFLEQRKIMLESGKSLDWGVAEALAYGSLLLEGSNVRMTGQDCKRGTFSHRHAVLFDQVTENEYTSLNHITTSQGMLEVANSNLSEYAVLGFEYGYSLVDPNNLVIWEAQFGDFANGAQIMIDQFISSAEVKWLRMSGLVMLLPHGYEGQGPEHSSARLERFLQLCAEDNMQVVSCSTPANLFHVIRRQIHRKFRKPLVVMSPKSLLRHKMVVSNLDEMTDGTRFRPVIADDIACDKVKRVVLCSGKVYFDLLEKREQNAVNNVALIRVEQLYPFPMKELSAELEKYKDVEVIWCQEEPKNMGAWHYIQSKIERCMREIGHNSRPKYVGRAESASPSAGYYKIHIIEQDKLITQAITGV